MPVVKAKRDHQNSCGKVSLKKKGDTYECNESTATLLVNAGLVELVEEPAAASGKQK